MPPELRRGASDASRSRGRRHAEPATAAAAAYPNDRDRIVHSTAFRRLVYKTQVFLNHEGDLFRTRLTHSIEVAQLARAMARSLRIDEDLCEAIALAHDLGHTPFGHAGQDALDACMREADAASAGFEHNVQSLRVVDVLEQRFPDFDGLNLTFETREGVLKHCSLRHARSLEAAEPGGPARRFIERTQPGLEAQLCNLADEIAYTAHDIDDGVRSGLLTHDQLLELPLFAASHRAALAEHPHLGGRRLLYDVIRRMLAAQVDDLVDASARRIDEIGPGDGDAVRRSTEPMIRFSAAMAEAATVAKSFLHRCLYRHPQVSETTAAARDVVRDLYHAYAAAPAELPADFAHAGQGDQVVADYIAGMTDRYALREHARLHGAPAAARIRERMRSASAYRHDADD